MASRHGNVLTPLLMTPSQAGLWVCLSATVRGFVYCTQVSEDLEELDTLFNKGEAKKRFRVGTTVRVAVVEASPARSYLSLKLLA